MPESPLPNMPALGQSLRSEPAVQLRKQLQKRFPGATLAQIRAAQRHLLNGGTPKGAAVILTKPEPQHA